MHYTEKVEENRGNKNFVDRKVVNVAILLQIKEEKSFLATRSMKMLNITYSNYEDSFLPDMLKLYIRKTKHAGLDKHSFVFYESDDVKNKDELLEDIKQIVKDNVDGIFVVFSLSNNKNTLDSIIMYFPKNGGIGRRLYKISAGDGIPNNIIIEAQRFYDNDVYSRALGIDVLHKYEGTGLKALEIFATYNGKVYDIIGSKLMMSKNAEMDVRKLFANIVFGAEMLGVAAKWELAK